MKQKLFKTAEELEDFLIVAAVALVYGIWDIAYPNRIYLNWVKIKELEKCEAQREKMDDFLNALEQIRQSGKEI